MSESRVKIELKKAPNYTIILASGVIASLNMSEGILFLYLDKPELEPNPEGPGEVKVARVVRELQCEIRLSPLNFKVMAEIMHKHADELEKQMENLGSPKTERQEDAARYL